MGFGGFLQGFPLLLREHFLTALYQGTSHKVEVAVGISSHICERTVRERTSLQVLLNLQIQLAARH